jgi:hypothetical protein
MSIQDLLHPNDRWLNTTRVCKRMCVSKQTAWRHRKAGIWPLPDGRDAKGNPLWLQSTIDNFLRGNLDN